MATIQRALPEVVARSKAHHSRLPWLVAALDLVAVTLSAAVALQFRALLPFFTDAPDVLTNSATASVFIIGTWMSVLRAVGSHQSKLLGAGTEEYKLVVNGSLGTAALVGVGAFLLSFPLSRGFFALLFLVGVPTLLLGRFAARRVLQRLRSQGRLNQRVVLVGSPGHVAEIDAVLRRESWLGYDVVGCLVPPSHAGMEYTPTGLPVLGTTDEVTRAVDAYDVEVVFFAGGAHESPTQLRRTAWELEGHGHVDIVVVPSLTDISSERIQIRPVAGLPLMHVGRPRSLEAASSAKRIFDIVGSALLLLASGPLLLALMAWIRLHDGGPAIFRQVRVGRDGEIFTCLKLRSMVMDAEAHLQHMQQREGHVLFKLENDPRITRPGRLIRRLSFDELPQLWNVLRGDMSLVGPRPPLPREVAAYENDTQRRLNVRPGMTGLWQVSGRADLSWEDTVRLDLYYVDNWSMVQDLTILARTFSAVVAARGAY